MTDPTDKDPNENLTLDELLARLNYVDPNAKPDDKGALWHFFGSAKALVLLDDGTFLYATEVGGKYPKSASFLKTVVIHEGKIQFNLIGSNDGWQKVIEGIVLPADFPKYHRFNIMAWGEVNATYASMEPQVVRDVGAFSCCDTDVDDDYRAQILGFKQDEEDPNFVVLDKVPVAA